MKAGICLTVKNEAPYLAEWIVYHLSLGFDHIWIYDNGSQDKIQEAMRSYLNRVELVLWPQVPAFPTNVRDCLLRAKAQCVDWLALFDADEFIVPVNGDPSGLEKLLQKADRGHFNQILMPIHIFASDGHILLPEGRVADNYRTETANDNYKPIVRVSSNPEPISTHRFSSKRRWKVSELQINHYRNKSKEDDLIRRGKGFVDEWGYKNVSQTELDKIRAKFEFCDKKLYPQNNYISQLSRQFNTPGTQCELAVDPVKVFIFERNQSNGFQLKEQLSSVFRDVVFWDIGSDTPNPQADAHFQNDGFTAQINRAHESGGNAEIIWLLPADVFLKDKPVCYKEAIVSAYPFGVWSPKIYGRHRKDQVVPDGNLCSVQFVEGIAWAISRRARGIRFSLAETITNRMGTRPHSFP